MNESGIPLTVQPAVPGVSLGGWAEANRDLISSQLAKHGATPIADVRKVYQRVDPEVRDRFIAKRWMVVRNYGDGFGLPWQTVYQTSDKAEVEAHCLKNGIQFEWKDGDRCWTT